MCGDNDEEDDAEGVEAEAALNQESQLEDIEKRLAETFIVDGGFIVGNSQLGDWLVDLVEEEHKGEDEEEVAEDLVVNIVSDVVGNVPLLFYVIPGQSVE